MNLATLQTCLGWMIVIHASVWVIWFVIFSQANDWLYRQHVKFFTITKEQFNAVHYALMGAYKLVILSVFIIPYGVLQYLLW